MDRENRIDPRSSKIKRILVGGGAGFIGSHLCDFLVGKGFEVLCIDNFFTGAKQNIEHLLGCANFELIRHDVRHPMDLEVDAIFNLACPASPRHYQEEPVRTVETSVVGAINMLRLARERGAVLLQASTSEVYGDPEVHPQSESYWGHVNPIGPRACYDEGKRCAETLCVDYRRQYGVQTKIARIFNTYGPRLSPGDGRVVSNFIVQALNGEPITVYGDGEQTRSFCYVDDMVAGLVELMWSPPEVCGPINLGNPGEFTVKQLAQMVIEMTGSSSPVEHCPLPPDDPTRRQPDIARARTELGWAPQISLREGLERTIPYFRGLLQGQPEAYAGVVGL